MLRKNSCPGCGMHCGLHGEPHHPTEPPRGAGKGGRCAGHFPEEGRGSRVQAQRMARYRSAGLNDKLVMTLHDLSHTMRRLHEGKASQKHVLIILDEMGATTQRDLTERLGIQPGSASEILFKLEHAGLIERTRNEADRRTTDVRLTEAGREFAAEALAQRRKRHVEMFECLSETERQELLSLLERVRDDWGERYGREGGA